MTTLYGSLRIFLFFTNQTLKARQLLVCRMSDGFWERFTVELHGKINVDTDGTYAGAVAPNTTVKYQQDRIRAHRWSYIIAKIRKMSVCPTVLRFFVILKDSSRYRDGRDR